MYASFRRRDGWHVEFFESDSRTPLRKSLRFTSEHKLIELAKRGRADLHVLETRQPFIDYADRIRVHKSLLNVILHDHLPDDNAEKPSFSGHLVD